ncbi:MAG: sialate O-acetylesterase [Planctomycetaceae bacterium]
MKPVSMLAFCLLLVQTALTVSAAEAKPLKVFILAGQSNMEGQAVTDLEGKDYNDGKGTLKFLMKDSQKAALFKHLAAPDGSWVVRDDVWCRYQREHGPLLKGPLSMGFSVYGDRHHFGPELQFGHVLGNHFDNPVLLIKTAWGGKSLYQDFRPPSSGGQVGPYYTKMIEQVRESLDNLNRDFPTYDGQGYELAGFVWYHGWNDGVEPQKAVPQYEQNLVNLIHDVRKEFQSPKLPVIIGELTGPWVEAPGEWKTLRNAQRKVAERTEFQGNVLFVETHDFVRKPENSPNPTHGHHEYGNAETYFLVGDALGKGMVTLLTPKSLKAEARLPQPTSRSVRNIEGWNIRVDDRLLGESEDAALGARALKFLEAKLFEIKAVVPAERLKELQEFTIVLDLNCGNLGAMQYHPDGGWLKAHGFPVDLAKCVHLPRAADVASRRNINEQPWVILHELAHAFHDQKLDFEEPRILAAYQKFKQSGHGDAALLYNGKRVKHYGLTDQKEFFAEMTESYFGVNDFFPFNRAELQEAEPELFQLLKEIWSAEKR